MGNDEKELSAEEYRKRATAHMQEIKKLWKTFGIAGVIVLAAVGVAIFLSVAWFVSNNKVHSQTVSVQSGSESLFELAAKGKIDDKGYWDGDAISGIQSGEEKKISGHDFVTTSNEKSSILWAITQDSNIENDSDKGINPGSKGKLTFYIIPNITGELTVTLDFAISGLDNEYKETVSEDAMDILKGHVLLFAGFDEDNLYYKGWISEDAEIWTMTLEGGAVLSRETDGTLTWKANVEEGIAYPVNLYWIWPEVFGEYIFRETTHTGNKPLLFLSDDSNAVDKGLSKLPDGLFGEMCNTEGKTTSNRYFKWASKKDVSNIDSLREEFASIVTADTLTGIRDSFNSVTYGKLCSYYNKADQYLGESIGYMIIRVDAK